MELIYGTDAERWLKDRTTLQLSEGERENRYRRIRQAMEKSGIDCLVLCSAGASWMYDGNWRYIIGDQLRSNPQIDFVVFPIDGEPTLILDYGLKRHLAEKSWTPHVEAPSDPRGRDPRGKSFSSLGNFTVSLSSVVRAARKDKGTIGITPASLPTIHYEEMRANLPEATFADCSRMMMDVRCIKSDEEIRLIRRSAKIADEAWGTACAVAREGMLEHQLVACWQHTAMLAGCERSFDMVATHPVGPSNVEFPGELKQLKNGDAVVAELSPVFAGYFSQLIRCLVVGELHPKLRELTKVCEEAFAVAEEQLLPGNTAGAVAERMEGVVFDNGYIPLLRGGHTSVGLDLLEIPLHPRDDTLLQPGMAVILHPNAGIPGYRFGDPSFLGPGDTYAITETGAERLTRSSQELIFV
ncbi:MAG: aminopeptidase P family protein [Hyphomicrobiales bacterium]|nr:aminopeptidase P family protein [Hyphomicrobiales bacterium]